MKSTKPGIDHVGVAVVFFCHDGKRNFVLAKRGRNARDEQGRWDIGGGGLEFGEKAEDRLKREIKEEYNLDAKSLDFLGFRDVHRTHQGRKTHWVALDFKVLVEPARLCNNEPRKFDKVGWFTLARLPKPLHTQLPYFLKKYKNRL